MKRNILKESEFSQKELKMFQTKYENMSEGEKISWKKAIEECIKEFSGGESKQEKQTASNVKFSLVGSAFGVGLIVTGVKLNIPELCLMGAGVLGITVGFTAEHWKMIIDCARKKKGVNKSTETDSETNLNESKMKKIIRLTESELVKLVQRIIKEDEMMGAESTGKKEYTTGKGFNVNFPLSVIDLKGYTPFYVNKVEKKSKIVLQPNDKISCKSCNVTLVRVINGLAKGKYYYINFDKDGNAKFSQD